MAILRFSAENHKCFRDRFELDLVSSSLKTQRPSDGDWSSVVHPVAGIFGANASGKSTVLDAIAYAREAVRASASAWLGRQSLPRTPFLLDDEHAAAPSTYVFDLVIDGTRHEYGFAVSAAGIDAEWLIDYPNGRRRLLFERDAQRPDAFDFGRSLERPATIAGAISTNELLISRGALLDHVRLRRVAQAITTDIELALFGEPHQRRRIEAIVAAVEDGTTTTEDILTLLRVADLGIRDVSLHKDVVYTSPRVFFADALALVQRQGSAGSTSDGTPPPPRATTHEPAASLFPGGTVVRRLEFAHQGLGESDRGLQLDDQSTGTISWLSLAVPAIEAVRRGSVLLIDEIDASLHPHLSSLLIGLFQDRTLNRHGAQLIFTSHDTFLLAPQSEAPLSSEQTWFTQKDREGAAELFSLADFTNRTSENVAKRYLAGRYGAVPRPAPSLLASLIGDEAAPA